jgi:hypothetical protein
MSNPIKNLAGAQTLAQAIIDTIPEPFIVLDDQFRVLEASGAPFLGEEPVSAVRAPPCARLKSAPT